MKRRFIPTSAALAITAALLGGCLKDDKKEDPVGPGDETGACVTDGKVTLSIEEDCTLEGGETYALQGLTFVKDGATLTIEPGARITGASGLATTPALVVQSGARLKAVGTKEKPIVFTSHDSQNPERGDFGGVVILGKAGINFAGGSTTIEGIQGMTYGGGDDADSSGELKYVRIEYAGFELAPNNEINGLTMGGVGSKTSISYVQVFEALDDCFEWFGGTVSAKYLACTGVDDDMFDWDAGWRGTLQFAVGAADASTNSDANGIEADNLDKNEENAPRSNPKVSNITLIGNGDKSLNGMRLRRGTAGTITNAIVTGFNAGAAVFVDGAVSTRLAAAGDLSGSGIYAYGNGRVQRVNAAGSADSAAAMEKISEWLVEGPVSLGLTAAEPKPESAPDGAVDNPSGMVTAKYLGAFAPGANLWTDGWTRDLGSLPTPVTSCIGTGNKIALQIEENCTIPGDGTYTLQGLTFVKEGATLTIGPGARITGASGLATTPALVVQSGARLKAVGTKEKPIVFTSHDSQNPERGDFGGVVILGKAGINFAGGSTTIEGIQGMTYGGGDDADSSGELKYVRIEYAGFELAPNNEINGLTMGGVGSKTSISYVQVFEALDDCFEWFGGTVSAKYLACTGVDDDMFDWDAGWRGTLQFAVGAADASTNSDANGIEADNLDKNEENTPRSSPKVSNITLIGNGDKSLNGMRLRRGTAGTITNAIVTGFNTGAAVFVDGAVSTRLAAAGDLSGSGIYAYGNGRVQRVNAAGSADSAAAMEKISDWLVSDTASLGVTAAEPKPESAPDGAVDNPSGMVTAKYLGAFDPEADALWTAGWTREP